MTTNYVLSDFISQWRVANLSRLKFATFHLNSNIILPIIEILYKNGVIRSYIYTPKGIKIYFKYYQSNVTDYYRIKTISTPGNRLYWTLEQLSKHYNQHNVCNFFIISTKYGLKTSTDCLFHSHIGGEILLKVEI